MSTETEVATQLSDYFGWVERELADTGLSDALVHRPSRHGPRHLRLALAAAAVLLVGGAVAALSLARDPARSVRPTSPTSAAEPTSPATSTQPAPSEWQRTGGPAITNRFQHLSIATSGGWFVWGGYSALSADSAGVALHDGAYYDAATGEWAVLPPAPFTADNPYVGRGVWTGTEVVITQGGPSPLVAAFDPVAFTWRTIPIPDEIRGAWSHEDSGYDTGWQAMIGGTVAVLFGHGSGSAVPASMLLLDPVGGQWEVATTPATLSPHVLASSSTQLFVVESGAIDTVDGCLGATWLHTYDLATDEWTDSQLPNGNWQPAFAAFVDGKVVLAGGADCPTNDTVRATAGFDPVTGGWSVLARVPADALGFGSPTSVIGGVAMELTADGRALAYDATLDAWWFGPSLGPEGATWTDDRMTVVVIDGRLAVWSPGWSVPGTNRCCDSTGEVFSLPLPDASQFGAEALPLTTTTTMITT